MPQKQDADIRHPERSHPTLTAREARERERQRQRDRRAQRRLERTGAGPSAIRVAYVSNTAKEALNSITIPLVMDEIGETN